MYDVIVIGGGPAGVTAALRARELGASVALVERGRLGGTCTNDGCVPTRVLARAARLVRDAEQFSDFGLTGARPSVDLERLLTRTQHTVYRIHEKKQLINLLEQAGVKLFVNAGHAHFTDEHNVQIEEGVTLRGEKFILCVGGRAHRLAFPGSEYALTHSDVWSLKRLPRTMAIVGGAATGSQLASIFAAFGTQVHMFEIGPHILRIEDELVSQVMEDAFRKRGIEITTGFGGLDRLEKTQDGYNLWYKNQDELQVIHVGAVVMATGWPGNADSLNLPAANLTSVRGYIEVDDYLRTSTPHIFAAGDITGRMMLVQSAGYEARIAAENAVLGAGQRYSHQIVPHGGFTDPEYASVGFTEEQARELESGYVAAVVAYADMDRAVIDGRPQGMCKLIISKETHRILGAHIVGEQALEIIQLVAAGMASDMWVEQLAELEIAYPTYTGIVGLAARKVVQELGVMPLSPQWRALGKAPLAEWERSEFWEEPNPSG
ncbi:MAG: NAD(P)/FAD-dependent oxidoreductase [Anaerolineales bacterium]|jgi:pyruvate/2-oxoglutarate dehydrogenase complex dihydrolipoamide dehydrogenase (E3) component